MFGASQYYLFADSSKMKQNEQYWTFESMQDEIAKASGIISKDTKNMTQGTNFFCELKLIFLTH